MSDEDVTPNDLRVGDREAQLEEMESWFRERFEDPAERTPYESAEGGYIWIWGGPYDAEWELRNEFEDVVPEDVIMELVDTLEDECVEWAPTEREGDYDEGLLEAVIANATAFRTLDDALKTVINLLGVTVPNDVEEPYRRLLYANAIAALETFLSDTFINKVFSDPALLQKYIDAEPKFSDRKVPFKDVLRESKRVTDEARKELLDTVWHNVGKVKAMYATTLGIDLGDLSLLARAIQTRHDIVHRNGRRKDGSGVEVPPDAICDLVEEIRELGELVSYDLDLAPDSGEDSPF
jgi:hypothetical protein